MSKIIVISVHPDDETLGCGGTLLKHQKNGDLIYCLYITKGNESQAEVMPKVNEKFNFIESFSLGLEELKLDDISLNIIIPMINDIFSKVNPNIIYIPNRSDIHSDHRRIFEVLIAATKSFRFPFINKILMYETLSETEFTPALTENAFIPNVFVDISEYMESKIEIMSVYKSEIMEDNFPRSLSVIKALGTYRGSRIGVKYAEAFMSIFEKC